VTVNATSKDWPVCLHETAGALEHGERRMPFVEMAHFRLNAERGKQPPPADPEKELLHQAQVRPATVKLAGDAAMHRSVRSIIAVQQVKGQAADACLPSAQPHRLTPQVQFQPQPLAIRTTQWGDRQLTRIVVGKDGPLRAVVVDHLAKITLAVE
jgi:hypothetical protein